MPVAFGAALLLAGCFSLHPVPPADNLPPLGELVSPTVTIDQGGSSDVTSTWGDGVVLLRPRLNGREVGWFILDTGASGWTITPSAAREAGLEPVAWTLLQDRDRTTVYRCERVEIGGVVLAPLHLSGLELRNARSFFGREVVGICGREFLTAAIIEVDGCAKSVRVHGPASSPLPDGVPWQPIEIHDGLPHIRCRYPDGLEGLFVLDTGCDQPVYCFGPAADLHGLRGYATGRHRTQVAYGTRQRVDVAILPSFTVAGCDFTSVAAILGPVGDPGAKLLPKADGVVGLPLWREHRLILDLGHDQVAVVRTPLSCTSPRM